MPQGYSKLTPILLYAGVNPAVLMEVSMASDYYWKERRVTLSSVVASFAVCMFMFITMFLAG